MTFRDEGFFHALQQNPDNDSLRLVYADFLEESNVDGSAAHAELIRIQIDLAARAPDGERTDARTAALTARQNDLLARWQRIWLGEWADVLGGCAFRRGLVEAIQADASDFLEHAADWFAQWPTLTVAKLTGVGDLLPELASSPWLAHLRGLDLSNNGLDSAALAHLTTSRFICLLQALDLSGNPIGAHGADLLASARSVNELSELHLAGCGLWHHGLIALLGGRSGRRMCWRRLDLSGNGLNRLALVRLADSPLMRNLEALDLALNPLGDNGASVLADSPNAAGLVDLGLAGTGTGDLDVSALSTSLNLTSLRSLDLRGHRCTHIIDREGEDQGGIGELARSPLLGQLRRLLLGHGPTMASNGWVTEVLSIARPPRQREVVSDWWMGKVLRKSRYLMPSQLVECDLDELWWLGDTRSREQLPPNSYQLGYDLDQVLELISRMDKSQATVLRMRFGLDDEKPMTRKEIGEHLGLSRERVHQIESEALNKYNKLRAHVTVD